MCFSFSDAILPQDSYKLKTMAKLRDPYYIAPYEKLPFEIEWRLGRILEQEIKNFRSVENAREMLLNSYDYDTLRCFNAIDEEMIGAVYNRKYQTPDSPPFPLRCLASPFNFPPSPRDSR